MNYKDIILILSIITTMHIHAMQMPVAEKSEQNRENVGPCYFAMLPEHVRDLIVRYLIFDDIESEEEFIERTKISKDQTSILSKYRQHLISRKEREFPGLERGWFVSKTLIAHCPNETNIAFLRFLCTGNNLMPELIIIDARKDASKDEGVVKNRISFKNIREDNMYNIALSRHGQLFATLYQELIIPFSDLKNINILKNIDLKQYPVQHNIVIRETTTQKIIQNIDFISPKNPVNPIIAFNKQGTHIIMHNIGYSEKDKATEKESAPNCRIFPIKVREQDAIPLKKTLQHYFQQRRICKGAIDAIK